MVIFFSSLFSISSAIHMWMIIYASLTLFEETIRDAENELVCFHIASG